MLVDRIKRHEMPIQNSFYSIMLKEMESLNQKKSEEKGAVPFGVLNKLWCDGAFDEFSDDHFMIHAFNDDIDFFSRFFKNHYIQTTFASAPYASLTSFPGNFVVNLENAFMALVSLFGYDNIRRFVTDQLSAGKEKYDEKSFFEALSEVHILSFFCRFGGMMAVASNPFELDEKGLIKRAVEPVGIASAEYEPQLNGRTNPEARFYYDDGTVLDVEIKTPNFSDFVEEKQPFLMPGVLLNSKGRGVLKETCENSGIHCLLPNVSKMKDYLNSAAKKFQEPECEKHINILCVNWTEAAIDKDDITEPLIILSNSTNGILMNKGIAEKCQVSQKALSRVSAVLLYKVELGALLFSDFRYIFANGKAKVVLNRFSKFLNVDAIHRITKLSCIYPEDSRISATIYANDICAREFVEEISCVENIIRENTLS